MRKLIIAIELQLLAALLATLRFLGGVRTDEAKYLLDIPYPHPPLARTALRWLTALPGHELLIRLLFATVLLQSAWLLWSALRSRDARLRWLCVGCWIGSGAVLSQAGAIMMSPLTALFGLMLVTAILRGESEETEESNESKDIRIFVLTIVWLASLFVAYQAVLYVPLLVAALRKLGADRRTIAICVLGPLVPLVVYTLSNPLIPASMGLVAGKDAGVGPLSRLGGTVWLLWVAGSGAATVLGVAGMILGRRSELIAAAALVAAYVLLSFQDYYAVLFVPLLLLGTADWARARGENRLSMGHVLGLTLLWLFALTTIGSPEDIWTTRNPARDTVMIASPGWEDRLLIVGPFGHEWQYYWPGEVVRYSPSLMAGAADGALKVCLRECPVALGTGGVLAMPEY